MKFEELMMQEYDEKQKALDLQQEVEQLEEELEEELKLTKVLKYALDGPCGPCLSSQTHLPFMIKKLLRELATLEEHIMCLERKFHKLNLTLYLEKKHNREWELQQLKNLPPHSQTPRKPSLRRQQYRLKFIDTENASRGVNNNHTKNPNKLAEDLIKCLMEIFQEMNQSFSASEEASDLVTKQISRISKTNFNLTAPHGSRFDPYAVLFDLDGAIRDIGPYKTFIQITRNTLDHKRISECSIEAGKVRSLMQKLCSVNLNLLTYKQKLAFWINIYNACIMHAFLTHGLPSTQEKLLLIMNAEVVNVGGVVVNSLAIEHFILRNPSNSNHSELPVFQFPSAHSDCERVLDYIIVKGPEDEREMLLRQAFGLGIPEPNVTFALCRGSWSSPALRVYTADDIVNELVRARLEYLQASVGVVGTKKIIIPKLLHWHIKDFATDMESLLEWIYSQLPQAGSLKRLIMECLNDETKLNPAKMIEIQPYVYEFRYLLPS